MVFIFFYFKPSGLLFPIYVFIIISRNLEFEYKYIYIQILVYATTLIKLDEGILTFN